MSLPRGLAGGARLHSPHGRLVPEGTHLYPSTAQDARAGCISCCVISFIIPAYNEANQIADAVRSIEHSAEAIGLRRSDNGLADSYEIIVVNDDSEDDTATLAAQVGAIVINVQKRQIAAVRNAGARAAQGGTLMFVDGDTFLNPGTLAGALHVLARGAIGGGACVVFDHAPWRARVAMFLAVRGLKLARCCGGCFLFTTRRSFDQIGGFDERLFASEECTFAQSLGRLGRFVVLNPPVVTSGRKVRQHSVTALLWLVCRLGARGPAGVRTREGLNIWYDGVREPAGAGADFR